MKNQTSNKSKFFKGYISSRKLNGSYIPQKLQNLAIRDFAERKNLKLSLSGTEWKIKNSYLMIRSIVKSEKKIDGIIFFSVFQIAENIKFFKYLILQMIIKKKIIYFVLEDLEIKGKKNLDDLIINLKTNRYLT